MNSDNMVLVQHLEGRGVLHSKRLRRALLFVDRKLFVPSTILDSAYEDEALPIGHGQTISQPYTVVFMLELLEVGAGDTVFEVGYGSGWQTALLAFLGREVHALEILPELCRFGRENVNQFPELAAKVCFYCQNATAGLFETGGFDRIIAAAAVQRVPPAWREQLKTGGIMVYPSEHSIWREVKKGDRHFERTEFPGFAFVPYEDGL